MRLEGLDNHGMGTVFEELIRRFNEENNEEAGEHFTPRDVVQLMARLVFEPIADEITSGTYLLYDGACGTGGMLTVAEETLQELAAERDKEVSTHLYGQEINAGDLRHLQGRPAAQGRGRGSRQHRGRLRVTPRFPTMASRPASSTSCSPIRRTGRAGRRTWSGWAGRRACVDMRASSMEHADDPDYSLVTRSSDGQMLFLANMLSKMKQAHPAGQPDRGGA